MVHWWNYCVRRVIPLENVHIKVFGESSQSLAIFAWPLWRRNCSVFDLDHDLANAIPGIYRVVLLPSNSHQQEFPIFCRRSREKKQHYLPLLLGGGTTQGIYLFFKHLDAATTINKSQVDLRNLPTALHHFSPGEMSQDLEEATKWVLETAVPLSGELSSSPLEDFWKALRRRKAWEILEHSSVSTIGHLRKTRTKERVKLWCPGPSWFVSFLRTSDSSRSLQVAILFHHHCLDQHILVVALCR